MPNWLIFKLCIVSLSGTSLRAILSQGRRQDLWFQSWSSNYKSCNVYHVNLESLHDRRKKNDLIFLYKILHGYVDINYSDFFQQNDFHGHNLRRHKSQLHRQETANSLPLNNFFTHRVIKNWNELPDTIVNSPSLVTFKHKLRGWKLK